ncbi:MAG: hypothetical protein LBM04_10730 [Opitutaceae bacterium]|jgi:hypothetical protein|nr:hypothetical protein [Opitutaceae bacterium]
MLDMTRLEKPKQHAGKLISACPACREEGRDKAGDHLAVFASGAYRCAVDDREGHRKRIFELAGMRESAPPPIARRPVLAPPRSRPAPPTPRLPALRPLNATEMARLAEHRQWPSTTGLELLTARGMLFHGRVWDGVGGAGMEHDAWIVTDRTRRNAQARRLDGNPWRCGKAKTLRGSTAGWPVGLAESRPYPHIMFCEGGPDFLAALLVALLFGYADTVAPVAMFGAGLSLPADALGYFTGKAVTIAQHADTIHAAGQNAAQRWAAQLRDARAASIHFADFAQVRMASGKPCKDLADFATTLRPPVQPNPPHSLCPAFQRHCELAPLGGYACETCRPQSQ